MRKLYTFNEDKTKIVEYALGNDCEFLNYIRGYLNTDINLDVPGNEARSENKDAFMIQLPEDIEYIFRLLFMVGKETQDYEKEKDNLLMSNAYLEGITSQNLNDKFTGYLVLIYSILASITYEKVAEYSFSEVGKLIGKENPSQEEIQRFYQNLSLNSEWIKFINACAEKREYIYQTARVRP